MEKFWKENQILKKSLDTHKDGTTYTFYDGPPTANGKPHIGHVLTRAIKDMIPVTNDEKDIRCRGRRDGIRTVSRSNWK